MFFRKKFITIKGKNGSLTTIKLKSIKCISVVENTTNTKWPYQIQIYIEDLLLNIDCKSASGALDCYNLILHELGEK